MPDFLYWKIRFALFLARLFRIGGYKCTVIGKCTILAPLEQMQIIVNGILYLRDLDPEMFRRLTVDHPYLFWYRKLEFIGCREIYTITDNFILWGNEGVATFAAQTVLDFNLRYLSQSQSCRNSSATRREIKRQVFEFVKKHSFSPDLIKQYQAFAE